ncbi:serine/threonine protein kinase, putative [Plasmodium berghei]|uniref:Serine/threonine protein kinase, putative n=2 Tax=Plasmodium berghei TaxID=5821 RepID=A0A509AP72_PLABA|nr:serine/threonine protein kinase, putative [Plasmodium berghei ANKA]CXI89197.1 serine/threonine protein kinase, putative [Plasmodium berghei]SCL96032.1 serine/threonine protein kinase, putative [Plasmodium berghei]SCM16345.1 serine/threonine protein kinase, putative [Plasmodium berghei]SCM18139.1 serine/threonine protein kinase, putative [Plasmodium berghei]SCN27566.1 serine/threonine protein kinase, putative [Plasmodium berghei]|eukprot:XP_034423222.1 serine/threonine protein kinase, putative [Plasmodium berghei ANKA]
MRNKEDYLISLFNTIEKFNNYCILYKKTKLKYYNFSRNTLTKNERNKDINEFRKKFNNFMYKLGKLKSDIFEENTKYQRRESTDMKSDVTEEGVTMNIISSDDNYNYEETRGNENAYINHNDHNNDNFKTSKKHINGNRSTGKDIVYNVKEEIAETPIEENKIFSNFTSKCNDCIKNKEKYYTEISNRVYSNRNNDMRISSSDIYSHTSSSTGGSMNSDHKNDNNIIISKMNNMLLKYIGGLDYVLNVKRVSKENLIREIKEFYRIHNSRIILDEYSTYLSCEIINLLKKRQGSMDRNTVTNNNINHNYNYDIDTNEKCEHFMKNGKMFFYLPSNYFFTKYYDDKACKENWYTSNCTNYEKSLIGGNTCNFSNNSLSISTTNHNIYRDNIYNNHNNKYNSPEFGIGNNQQSPKFGMHETRKKNSYINVYKDGNKEYNKDENIFYNQTYEIGDIYLEDEINKAFDEMEENGFDGELNNCQNSASNQYSNSCSLYICNDANYYKNEDELKNSINSNNNNSKAEYDYYNMCVISNGEGKTQKNLSSNTSDFYQSVSNFYKSKENRNTNYENNHSKEKNNNLYVGNSSTVVNSNETQIITNQSVYPEKGENIINLCFDDELSSAMILNNEFCLNKKVNIKYDTLVKENKNINEPEICYDIKNMSDELNHQQNEENLVEYEKDEKQWINEYCDGDYNLYRSLQLKNRKETILSYENIVDIYNLKEEENENENENKNPTELVNNKKKMNIVQVRDYSESDNGNNDNYGNNIDKESNYENKYNMMNLKVVYENNKIDFGSNSELKMVPGHVILNKYKIIKVLSKTTFSTTLKCLNLDYKNSIKNGEDSSNLLTKEKVSELESVCKKSKILSDNPNMSFTQNLKDLNNKYPFDISSIKKNNSSEYIRNSTNNKNNGIKKKYYKYVCLKVMKKGKNYFDQGLFELTILNMLSEESINQTSMGNNKSNDITGSNILTNKNIIQLYDYFYLKGHLIIVTEYMESDLYNYFIKKGKLGTLGQLQILTKNLLQGLAYIHSKKLIHCDLKPENIMINIKKKKKKKKYPQHPTGNNNDETSNVQISHDSNEKNKYFSNDNDFDKNRENIFSSDQFSKIKIIDFNSSIFEFDKLEMYVQTRPYRSPEVLLQHNYDSKIDMWSLGCILFEFLTKKILFDHKNIYRFIYSIASYIGSFPFYMIITCKIPYIFTKHGYMILKKIIYYSNDDDYPKEDPIDEIEDEPVIFNKNDFFCLNKKCHQNDLLKIKNQNPKFVHKQTNHKVYYDICYSSNTPLENNFQIDDLLFINFLLSLLQIDPCKRLNSKEALDHPWLKPNLYPDGL